MRIETTIQPRKDGTVSATLDGQTYKFKPDEYGRLIAEVGDPAHAAYLLDHGDDFLPADESDLNAFLAAPAVATPPEGNDDEPDDDDENDDEAVNLDAPPIEEPASVVAAPAVAATRGRGRKGR